MIYTHYLKQNTLLLLNQTTLLLVEKTRLENLQKQLSLGKKQNFVEALEKATEKVTFFYLLTASKLVSEIMN